MKTPTMVLIDLILDYRFHVLELENAVTPAERKGMLVLIKDYLKTYNVKVKGVNK
jgi:hypothetical protein